MSTMSLKHLVDKLNQNGKKALEGAAGLCHSRSQFTVEIEHWLLQLVEDKHNDIAIICQLQGVDLQVLTNELNLSLERQKTGNSAAPSLSPHIITLLRQAWLNTTIEFDEKQIRSGIILFTLLSDDSISAMVSRHVRQLERLSADVIRDNWSLITEKSAEHNNIVGVSNAGVETDSKTPSLDQFTVDLTQKARSGKMDPILGRDPEIRQMVDILTRRRQNNPILTGDAGVGKTAVVEGLAQRIAAKDVPESLQHVQLRELDLALLQAGAGMKGEFENRLKAVLNEVKQSAAPIILFIDEAHTMIGAGGAAGQNDAANILKPALARGELRTIAATTWAEYKKYFEKDPALTRRFQVVKIDEPSVPTAIIMLRGILPVMEQHHDVVITADALQAAVALSKRYINGRQLPDKAVALLDTACARVAISQAATPGLVEDLQRQQVQLETEIKLLEREQVAGDDHSATIAELNQNLQDTLSKLETEQQAWHAQAELVQAIQQQITDIHENGAGDEKYSRLTALKAQLHEAKNTMVYWQVDEQVICEVISDWTGIPLGKMAQDELETVINLAGEMKSRVIGQDHAIDLIAKTVQISRAQLSDENKPNGIFLLTGPSGVGKTEAALTLAEQVYGSEDNIITINMSEYKEEHKVSLLLGSPPGYVGYGEGGVLTEAVRRNPYSVVLLDEMDKAAPGVQDIFYQIFDKGCVKDGEGRDIDFKNTIIIMTSNVGTDTIMGLFSDPDSAPELDCLADCIKPDLTTVFKPAFLGRANVVPFVPLTDDMLGTIAQLQLNRLADRIRRNHNAAFTVDDGAISQIVSRCHDAASGARTIHNYLQNTLLPEISVNVLEALTQQIDFDHIKVITNEEKFSIELI
jgi:type VI secretion system protein VasG